MIHDWSRRRERTQMQDLQGEDRQIKKTVILLIKLTKGAAKAEKK